MSFPLRDFAEARRAARHRDPDGARMGRFRWAAGESGTWLWAASLPDRPDCPAFAFRHPLETAGAHPYWLAHAIRQTLWRELRGVRGFRPVVRVAPGQVMAGGFAPTQPRDPGVFTAQNTAQWLRWARVKARAQR
ncbi:MAG: hypothetical protein AAGI70_11790 [Pseudomonadota bacterium]